MVVQLLWLPSANDILSAARYHSRFGLLELEPSVNQLSALPTSTGGFLNSIIRGPSASTLSFVRDPSFSSSHIVDYNLTSHPRKIDIPFVIAMVQHQTIRQRIKFKQYKDESGINAQIDNDR